MGAGGAETFLMKIYRNIDRSRYQMDFAVAGNEKGYYDERNEWACRLAWETISHLESMELYHKTTY